MRTAKFEILWSVMVSALLLGKFFNLSFGFPLHYLLLALGTLFLVPNIWPWVLFNPYWTVVVAMLLVACLQIYFSPGLTWPVLISSVYYIVIPLVFSSLWLNQTRFIGFVGRVFYPICLIYLLGLLMQQALLFTEYFPLENVDVGGEVVPRYTSVAGGCLALGYSSAIFGLFFSWSFVFRRRRLVDGCFVVAALYCSIASMSRGSTILFVVGAVAMAILQWIRNVSREGIRWRPVSFVVSTAATSLALVALAGWLKFSDNPMVQRVRDIGNFQEEGNFARIKAWQEGIRIGLEHPWIGTGLGTTGSVTAANASDAAQGVATENFFLKLFAEGGFPVLLMYVILFVVIFTVCILNWRYWTDEFVLCAGMVIAIGVSCFYLQVIESPLYCTIFWTFFGMLVPKLREFAPVPVVEGACT